MTKIAHRWIDSAHLCLVLLVVLALGQIDGLTWKEYLRLAIIDVGLLYVYFKGSGLLRLDSKDEGRYLSFLLALVLTFVVAQFDPVTSGIDAIDPYVPLNWFFWGSTALIGGALVAFLKQMYWGDGGHQWRIFPLDIADKVVLGACVFLLLLSVATWMLFAPPLKNWTSVIKIGQFGILWLIATRIYRFPLKAESSGANAANWPRLSQHRQVLLVGAILVFTIISFYGATSALRALYHYRSGQQLQKVGNGSEALTAYKQVQTINRVLDIGPLRHKALESMGKILLEQGQHSQAEETMDQLRASYRQTMDEREVQARVGDLYRESGATQSAIVAYEAALKAEGNEAAALIDRLGALFVETGQLDAYLGLVKQKKWVPSTFPSATYRELLFSGYASLVSNQAQEALQAFDQAFGRQPDEPGIPYLMAGTLMEAGMFDQAIVYLHRALEADSGFFAAHFNLGVCRERLGALDEAEKAYRQTLALNGAHLEALLALQRLGRGDEVKANIAKYRPSHETSVQFSRDVRLVGYDLDRKEFERGEAFELTTYWTRTEQVFPSGAFRAFFTVDFSDESDTLYRVVNMGDDFSPPVSQWSVGAVVKQHHTLQIGKQLNSLFRKGRSQPEASYKGKNIPRNCQYSLNIGVLSHEKGLGWKASRRDKYSSKRVFSIGNICVN